MSVFRPMLGVIGMTCGSAVVAAPSVSTFDLHCSPEAAGMEVAGEYKDRPTNGLKPFRFSVDLKRSTWCHQPCRIRGDVKSTDRELRLEGGPSIAGESRGILINRDTGLLVEGYRLNGSIIMMNTYKCSLKPYTAIPVRKF